MWIQVISNTNYCCRNILYRNLLNVADSYLLRWFSFEGDLNVCLCYTCYFDN